MSGRSSSGGVSALRARYETTNQSTSPPSRGRSPSGAGSVTSNDSRPVSRVRANFIPVGPSPRMGPLKEINAGAETTHEGEIPKLEVDDVGTDQEQTKTNGHASSTAGIADPLEKVKETEAINESSNAIEIHPKALDEPSTGKSVSSPGKVSPTPKSDASGILPTDPEVNEPLSAGAGKSGPPPNLGAAKASQPTAPSALSKQQSQTPKTAILNGHPKKPAGESNSKSAVSRPVQESSKNPVPSKPASKTSAPLKQPQTPSPFTPEKLKHQPEAPKASSPLAEGPAASTSPGEPAAPKASNPKVNGDTKPKMAPKSSRPLTVPKAPSMAAPRARQSGSTFNALDGKKSGPTSPVIKSRPRSPTRPVRLPASATAPTASSAAKLDKATTSRSPNRASITSTSKPSTLNRDRASGVSKAAPQLRSKPLRTSLPAQSAAAPQPKPRASLASNGGSDGGFLARMMRPTQSSASKTHEKIEQKTPPKKVAARPKRKSDESEIEPQSASTEEQVPQITEDQPAETQEPASQFDGNVEQVEIQAKEAVETEGSIVGAEQEIAA